MSSLVAESVELFIKFERSVRCDNWWVTTYEFSESVDKTARALVNVVTYCKKVGSDNTPSLDEVWLLSHCSAAISLSVSFGSCACAARAEAVAI